MGKVLEADENKGPEAIISKDSKPLVYTPYCQAKLEREGREYS